MLAEKQNEDSLQYATATYIIVLIMTIILSLTLLNLLIGISVGSIDTIQKNALLYQAKLKIHLFLQIDPNIPTSWKNKIVPDHYTIKRSKPNMATFLSNLWNYVSSLFAFQVEDDDGKEKELNQDSAKLDDMYYRIRQMEGQIDAVIKQQKWFCQN